MVANRVSQMAARFRFFSAERRAEGVDQRKSHGVNFGFQLTAHGEAGPLAKEIFVVVNFPIIFWWVGHIQCRHLKHLSRAFAIARRNNRRIQVNEPAIVEEAVNGIRQTVAHTHHRTDRVGAGPQVGYLPQVLQRVEFFL